MFIPFLHKNVASTLLERVENLESGNTQLKKRVLDLEIENESFRNKVLRKVQTKKEEEPAQDTDFNAKKYKGVLLPEP